MTELQGIILFMIAKTIDLSLWMAIAWHGFRDLLYVFTGKKRPLSRKLRKVPDNDTKRNLKL